MNIPGPYCGMTSLADLNLTLTSSKVTVVFYSDSSSDKRYGGILRLKFRTQGNHLN